VRRTDKKAIFSALFAVPLAGPLNATKRAWGNFDFVVLGFVTSWAFQIYARNPDRSLDKRVATISVNGMGTAGRKK